MAVAADEFFGHPTRELEVAGVTGTNGKTTTAYLLYAILDAAGRGPGCSARSRAASATSAGRGAHDPEAIDLQRTFREMLDAGNRSCAIEATSHGSELRRLDGVRFAALVFTNLTQDHLDFHGTMERYFEAKRRLFAQATPPAAVNVGDEYGRRLADELPHALTFGFADDADVRPERARRRRPQAARAASTSRTRSARSPRRAARDRRRDAIARGLESVDGVPGRFEEVDEGQPFTVLVDYAHTPDALENVLARRATSAARDLRLRLRRRPRPREAPADGPDRDRARRRRDRHLRQPAQRGSASDHRRDRRRRRRRRRGRARPRARDRARSTRRARRRRRDRRQGPRAGAGDRDRKLPFDDREVARDALRRCRASA